MKKAVLLCSMGGPAKPNDVVPFLFRLFMDRHILPFPLFFRFLLATLISVTRGPTARAIYAQMGGGSPLLEETKKQAAALERACREGGEDVSCFVGMSYAAPFIRGAIKEIKAYGPDEIVLLPLYPQYSTTTTQSVIDDVSSALSQEGMKAPLKIIHSFHTAGGYLDAFAENIKTSREEAREKGYQPHVLFSAHGLPLRIVEKGDPYPDQCAQTAQALAERLGLSQKEWTRCYQSRVGRGRWLEPSTESEVSRRSKQGEALIVVPLSFVTENAETLVELGIEYRNKAVSSGATFYALVRTVSCHPRFINALAALVSAR